jgi:transcription-repair coupling factor (superfamily II helicase)
MPLLDRIASLPAYRDLLARLESGHETVTTARGLALPRSARLPLVARLQADLRRPILVISNRADRALALYDELQFWLGDVPAYYFPEPNPLFYEQAGWGKGTRRDRLQVLTMLARTLIPNAPSPEVPPVIVTPIRALMARTLPRRDYLKRTRTLRLGQQVTPDELTRTWVDIGYDYANIVVEAGQFSRRGGILDVWPPGEARPARIEFFGDEIDTMRAFDPASQRTVDALDVLTIPPAREILPMAA